LPECRIADCKNEGNIVGLCEKHAEVLAKHIARGTNVYLLKCKCGSAELNYLIWMFERVRQLKCAKCGKTVRTIEVENEEDDIH